MNNQAIIRRPDDGAGDMVKTLDDVLKLSDIVAKSAMFPDLQSQARAAMIIIAGQEIGVPPMASLRGLYVQKGKVEIHAGLLAAMIKSSGKYEYKVMERTDKLCRLAWFENDKHVGDSQYTIEDAQRAQLVKPDSNWAKSPRAMCFARALTEGQRVYAPDIAIGSAYSQGEIPTDDIEPAKVDFEFGDIFEEIGGLLKGSNQDDSSGARRYVFDCIKNGAYQAAAQYVNTPVDVVIEIANRLKSAAHVQIEQDLNKAQTGLDQLRQGDAGPVAATEADKPAADPVAPLQVKLTPAQQKVSDAVMSLLKEHKKERAEILTAISEVVKRTVLKSSELTDDEAERVYRQLETWASTLAGLKDEAQKAEPVAYNQRNRAHGEEIAKRLDAVYMRLGAMSVGAGALLDKVNAIMKQINQEPVDTRYALDDYNATIICQEFEKWANELAKEQSA